MNALRNLIETELEARNFGFDWPNFQMIIDQAIDECREIQEVIDLKESQERLQEEIGDLLHTAISMCIFAELSIEETVSITFKKFKGRIDSVKYFASKRGYKTLKDQPIDLLLELWHEAKNSESLNDLVDDITTRLIANDDIELIVESFESANWYKPASIFENYLVEQEQQQRLVKLAFFKGKLAGYATLKWHSDYQYFAQNNIPEIKDLNILPQFRKKGIGSRLIKEFENMVRAKKYSRIGLGVGLYEGYGNAQKLYVSMNYKPDGRGIVYKDKPISYGENIILDDDLTLMFTKELTLPLHASD